MFSQMELDLSKFALETEIMSLCHTQKNSLHA